MVYSVCSLFPDEGEDVIRAVVRGGIEVSTRRLYPETDGTDGFFIAVVRPQ